MSSCQQIEDLNFDDLASIAYPDRKDLDNIQLAQMNLAEFIYLTKKVCLQFRLSLDKREISLVLPANFNHAYGSSTVEAQMQTFSSYVNQANFASAENFLIWLVGYQLENGIFKLIGKNLDSASGNLSILSEKLRLIQLDITKAQQDVSALYLQMDNSNKEAQNLINQKKDELAQITTNLTTSNSQISQISDILNKATEANSRLATILEQQETAQASIRQKTHRITRCVF
jgi:hypothetical protein